MRRPGPAVLRRVCATLVVGVVSTAVAGCGSVVAGEAVRAEPDLSGLDVGNYPTEPVEFGAAEDNEAARYREGQRLGDFVALPFEADPGYVDRIVGTGGPVVLDRRDMQALVVNDTFDEVAADLVAGWVHTWSTEGDPGSVQQLSIAVLMFPDAATAESVAVGLERDDFTFNADNRPVQLSKYPQGKAHWRPGNASLGSWTAHDRYVVFVKYDDRSGRADLPAMVQRTESLLDIQMPLLDEFEPTPPEQLNEIALDPDGVLALTLPKSPQTIAMFGPPDAFRGRGAVYALTGITNLDFLDTGQVTGIALGESVVVRSETLRGAEALYENFRPGTNDSGGSRVIEAPKGIDGKAECFSRQVAAYENPSSFCVLRTGRYFAQVEGGQIQDLHQKTSAQYALLLHG
ncbi:DUF7373 family lipoprotein [Nocardia jinanensis]|uniref:Uncharacterized protein n=1 Tax=Nocardia jinanensis TaxID=382504 RepID=A0A917RSE1_9NOCA|nr:hypothetical protein [Nocardia jinanensis]GGL24148.1 hypothetical protein GCM10011588_43680 [Nocardia jinanensis]